MARQMKSCVCFRPRLFLAFDAKQLDHHASHVGAASGGGSVWGDRSRTGCALWCGNAEEAVPERSGIVGNGDRCPDQAVMLDAHHAWSRPMAWVIDWTITSTAVDGFLLASSDVARAEP
jgi:hypothetical protein